MLCEDLVYLIYAEDGMLNSELFVKFGKVI